MSSSLSVIGCGYLGAVHAVCMANLGHHVVAVDTDAERIATLNAGKAPFYEPGLPEMLADAVATGRLEFTTDLARAAEARVHFLCVGTPQLPDGLGADTSQVVAAVRALAPYAAPGSLVVGKSTVPVGTAEQLCDLLWESGADSVSLAWNPEFLREGFAIQDTLHPDRIVYGVAGADTDGDVALLDKVYAAALSEQTPRLVTDLATAQLVKVAANGFLATKISFINAMASLCDRSGGDVTALAEAIGHDARIGHRFLGAGVGFGGGCLPKDVRALVARAEELGAGEDFAFLREVDGINRRRRDQVVAMVREECGDLTDQVVTVLGAAFKPDSDDIRDSPALDVAERLSGEGALVRVHDPHALDNARRTRPAKPGLSYVDDLGTALHGSDVIVHLTGWAAYAALEPENVSQLARGRVLIDGRNALDQQRWRDAGWTYRAMGRPA